MLSQQGQTSVRTVSRIHTARRFLEGGGFAVRRPFPTPAIDHFDPFLLLDEMGPSDYGPGEAVGAPDHPHRGFETVTYLLSGRMQHKDSRGHTGQLNPGDVQWMTAGSGVIHSEMPEEQFLRTGGRLHGFQLWVNLPRADKMMAPRYQELPGDRIPTAVSPDGKAQVRVIAGEAWGVHAAIETRTPIHFLHFTVEPGGRVVHPVPWDFNVFAHVFGGQGVFGADSKPAKDGQMVAFSSDGEAVSLEAAGPEKLQVLLIGGRPLREPVARYGPFVMNTEDEIYQAVEDYNSGHFGEISH